MVHRFSLHRKLLLLVMAMFTITSVTNAQLPVRKVLVEKQTGAWCQYCPGGIEAFDQIHKQYPEDAILAAYHQGDMMEVPEQETIRAAGYWSGYPSGTVNRSDAIATHPTTIASQFGQYVGRTSIVAVRLKNVNFNAGTRALQVEVEAKFFAGHTGEKRFNLLVIEDSVTGSGTGYDQVNAYNTQQGSKWFGKGNPIKNFYHRHVVRKVVGGAWGVSGSLPNIVQTGDIKTYTFNTKLDNTWKPERMYLVAMVAEYDNDGKKPRTVLNAEEERLTVRSARAELSLTNQYNVIKAAQVIEKTVTVKNTNAVELTYDLSIDETSDYPGDWTAELSSDNVKIAAGKSTDVTLKITAGGSFDMASLAKINVKAMPRAKAGIDPRESVIGVYALTDIAKYMVVQVGGFTNWGDDYASLMSESELYGKGVFKTGWDEPLINAFKDQFEGFAFQLSGGIVTQTGVVAPAPLAATGSGYPNLAKMITDLLGEGKSVFLSAPRSIWWASNDPNAAQGNVPEAVSFFKDFLKIQLKKSEQRFSVNGNTYSLTKFNVAGIQGNPITDNLNGLANDAFSNYTMYTDLMTLSSSSTCTPILTCDNKPENIVGVSYQNDKKGRLVFLTVPVEAFNNAFTRSQFITKSWDWLLEGKVDKPKVAKISSTVNSIDFKDVVLNKVSEQKFEIENTGEIPLVIKEIKLDGSNPEVFEMASVQLPLSLEPGQKKEFTVTFTPKAEKTYLAIIQFVSNADGEESNSFTIDIEGKGVSDAPKPSVLKASVDKVEFGSVSVGSTAEKALKIKNTSDKAIEIVSVAFEGTNASNFSSIEKPELIPTNIELPFKLGFTSDKAGTFVATMIVTSKIDENTQDVFRIDVSASAVASGVYDDAVSQSMKIEVGPNPASVQSQVNFTLNGTAPQSVEISVLDMKGSVVMSLHNGMLLTGSHSLSIDAGKLAAGAYKVIARTNNESVSVPLMIVR